MDNRYAKKTRIEYVSGKLSRCHFVRPDTMYEPAWTVMLHPDKDSLEKIRDWQAEGLKNTLKKDDDGYFTRFKCQVSRKRKDGTAWVFEPPVVIDKEGKPMDGSAIGDGSDGVLKLEVYEHPVPGGSRAIAARLVGARIDNLVPWEPENDDPEGRFSDKDLSKQPPLF